MLHKSSAAEVSPLRRCDFFSGNTIRALAHTSICRLFTVNYLLNAP